MSQEYISTLFLIVFFGYALRCNLVSLAFRGWISTRGSTKTRLFKLDRRLFRQKSTNAERMASESPIRVWPIKKDKSRRHRFGKRQILSRCWLDCWKALCAPGRTEKGER
jgi:hypothetical protein